MFDVLPIVGVRVPSVGRSRPPANPWVPDKKASDIIAALGLGSACKVSLDAGDQASYDTGGTKWLDTSGNGFDFFRGTSASSEATDPAFNGTPGAKTRSEFFSFDGGDRFVYDSANEAFFNSMHKAGAKWTVAGWVWPNSLAALNGLMGTGGGSNANAGVEMSIDTTGRIGVTVRNKSGTATGNGQSDTASPMVAQAWNFFSLSYDEAAGAQGITYCNNGKIAHDPATIANPTTDDASVVLCIGSRGAASTPMSASSRMALFWIFNDALSAEALMELWAATHHRYLE